MSEFVGFIFDVLLIITLGAIGLGVWGIYDELAKINKREDKKPIKFS